ncbi:hypothetical protein HWV62_10917 [Athelia sp. TMB]|nr:hypothetical protein HWV62_10917 [Athelia sp. TMB]
MTGTQRDLSGIITLLDTTFTGLASNLSSHASIIQESMNLRQARAEQPAIHTERFAMTAEKLSTRLVELGHHEEALRLLLDAVEVFRILAAERPSEFDRHLASSLKVLAVVLNHLGHESLNAEREAAAVVDRIGGAEGMHAVTRRRF